VGMAQERLCVRRADRRGGGDQPACERLHHAAFG
jgi:hypothetical protein